MYMCLEGHSPIDSNQMGSREGDAGDVVDSLHGSKGSRMIRNKSNREGGWRKKAGKGFAVAVTGNGKAGISLPLQLCCANHRRESRGSHQGLGSQERMYSDSRGSSYCVDGNLYWLTQIDD